MYSLSLNRRNQYKVNCKVVQYEIHDTSFVVDTGAAVTLCRFDEFFPGLSEIDVKNNRKYIINGFVRNKETAIPFYEYPIRKFVIADEFEINDASIWITFSPFDITPVLGMNLLSKTLFLNDYKVITFFNDYSELSRYLTE